MSKHTPGPWTVDGEHLRAVVRGADMAIVAVRHRLPAAVHEANARLIAAAPDMLEALEKIANGISPGTIKDCEDIARAAIAKATG